MNRESRRGGESRMGRGGKSRMEGKEEGGGGWEETYSPCPDIVIKIERMPAFISRHKQIDRLIDRKIDIEIERKKRDR